MVEAQDAENRPFDFENDDVSFPPTTSLDDIETVVWIGRDHSSGAIGRNQFRRTRFQEHNIPVCADVTVLFGIPIPDSIEVSDGFSRVLKP